MIIWVMIVISVFSDMTVGIASGTVAALILVIVRFSKLEVRNICGTCGGEVPGDVLFPRRNAAFYWKTAVNFFNSLEYFRRLYREGSPYV